MKPTIQLRLGQHLTMTPQLQQAIRLLQLSTLDLKQEIHHLIAVHDHVEEFLERTRAAGKRVVLLTNAHAKSLDLKMEVTGLTTAFDALICAHDIGYPKEDQRFWSHLGEYEAFNPKRTLFVDDSLPVLRAARDYGVRFLRAVALPDTRSPPKPTEEFIAINSFNELLEGLSQSLNSE